MKDIPDRITVGMRLKGPRERLESVASSLDREIEILPWRPDGGWPVPLAKFVREGLLDEFAKKGRVIRVLDDFPGGEVLPHFHHGDEIVFLGREDFKELVGRVAMDLGSNMADRLDYEGTVDIMSRFAIDTVPLPE